MHRRCVSWHAVPLHTPSGVLHKNAFSDEAASFHFAMKHCSVTLHNMKHSAHAPYDEKMKNESYVCKYSLSMLHYSAERKILMEKSSNKLLDLSCDYAESNIERITFKEFHDKLSEIVHKYNPELVDRLNQVQVLDRKATPLLEDNKDNN